MTMRKIYQPLSPSVRVSLDPEYVAFHDQHLQYVEPDDVGPWDPVLTRSRVCWPPSGSRPLPVQSIRDIQLENCPVRVFTPTAAQPAGGWPVLVWYHGGGWALGGIESENDFCTLLCNGRSAHRNTTYRGQIWHRCGALSDGLFD